MKLKQSWKDELLALVNSKNSLQLTLDDVKFELTEPVSEVPGTVVVTIKPSDDSRYFNEQSLTYIRRDIAKNFTGIPLRVIVKQDTAVRDIINTIAERYGLVFDTTVDFLESELNKQITFTDTGIKDITVPVANTSYVWAGNLQFNVANDKLNLITIIKNTDLTNLAYLKGVDADTTGSLLLATAAVVDDSNNPKLNEGKQDAKYFENVLNVMARYGDLTDEQVQSAMTLIIESEDNRETKAIQYGSPSLIVSTKNDWVIGNFKGEFVVGRKADQEEELDNIFTLSTNGGIVTLSLNAMKNINIDWGDGNKVVLDAGTKWARHEYADNNPYQIEIMSSTDFDATAQNQITGGKITAITYWASQSSKAPSFNGCMDLVTVPSEIPATWTALDEIFAGCAKLNDANIVQWDTTNITSMRSMFSGCSVFNQPIADWNVGSVTNIDAMFSNCYAFNQDLSGWKLPSGVSHDAYDVGATAWQEDHKPTFS